MQTPSVLDFHVKSSAEPRYRYLRVPLNNIQGSILFSAASQLLEFKLPVAPYNLSRSYIQYSINAPAGGVNLINNMFEDLSLGELAQSVTFGNASGLNLVDLNYLQNFMKPVLKAKTTSLEFEGRDPLNSYYPAINIGVSDVLTCTVDQAGDKTVNSVTATTLAGQGNFLLAGYNIQAASNNYYSLKNSADEVKQDVFLSPFKTTDPKYSVQSAANAILTRNRQIQLSDVKDTFFSEDKDFYSPTEMYLRVQSNPLSKIGCRGLINDPTNNGVPTSLSAATALSNVYLYLAVEQNQMLIDELIGSVRSGQHKFTIPYTVGFRNNIAAPGSGSIQIQMTSQYGKKLHHVTMTVGNAVESNNTAVDSANYNGAKISSYQTFLDNRPLTDYVLSCAQPSRIVAGVNADDWRENRKFIMNKKINAGQYQLNWFHCDAFYDPETGDEGLDLTNTDAGLDMDAVRLWQAQVTVPAAAAAGCNVYTFATFLREVMIDAQGNILFG